MRQCRRIIMCFAYSILCGDCGGVEKDINRKCVNYTLWRPYADTTNYTKKIEQTLTVGNYLQFNYIPYVFILKWVEKELSKKPTASRHLSNTVALAAKIRGDKVEKSTSISIISPIFKTSGKLSRQPLVFVPNDCNMQTKARTDGHEKTKNNTFLPFWLRHPKIREVRAR